MLISRLKKNKIHKFAGKAGQQTLIKGKEQFNSVDLSNKNVWTVF